MTAGMHAWICCCDNSQRRQEQAAIKSGLIARCAAISARPDNTARRASGELDKCEMVTMH